MATITSIETHDVRFPTSRDLSGSDATNPDPDYSAAYCVLRTDDTADGWQSEGHGFSFTIGRGTEIVCTAIDALKPRLVGRDVDAFFADMGSFWRHLVGDSQLRWIGPEKGAIHLATAALTNAVWDLYAKREGKPLWKLLADMTPEQIVSLVDFRWITDAVTPEEAVDLLAGNEASKKEREAHILGEGLPHYTTSAGWLGYPDDKLRRLCREAVAAGFDDVKMKVGADLDDDMRRAAIVREEIGPERNLMMDANQHWGVDEAIANMGSLARFDPLWIEEPTSPDDILGHARIAQAVAPVGVATGEHAHNRVMFKQLLQADAISYCQVDACRLGGVNEVLSVLLMAAKFGVPVCPHAGGVGLCELVQHVSAFNYVAVRPSLEGVTVEYVDHLHEHMADPVTVRDGRWLPPDRPGYSSTIKADSLEEYAYPDGVAWANP
ncbi:enolase C-terminal domain-like protein [soil metagenome]